MKVRELIGGVRGALESNGFEDVQIQHVLYPQHVIEWLATEDPDVDWKKLNPNDLTQDAPYLNVSTDVGEFSVFCIVHPMFDLTGTGIGLKDLFPEDTDASDDFPYVGFDDGILLKLWQLLVKKQRITTTGC